MKLLRAAKIATFAVTWVSGAIFGAYIVAFYGGTLGSIETWNATLPKLYERHTPAATLAIGVHFATGGILLLLGPLQLVARVRNAAPAVHRWIGRLYVAAAILVGLGGLGFIAAKGTIGGRPMDIGFGLYGVLVVLAAVQTFRFARIRDLEPHRAWAIRLYALAIGSWLYRMDYGFWALFAKLAGHTPTFDGPFDVVMAFFFYLPNLVVAELVIRARTTPWRRGIQITAALALLLATLFVAAATVVFTKLAWWPGIRFGLAG